jgi:hypothetical protein
MDTQNMVLDDIKFQLENLNEMLRDQEAKTLDKIKQDIVSIKNDVDLLSTKLKHITQAFTFFKWTIFSILALMVIFQIIINVKGF